MNRGFTVRGMDYAIMSGIAAAETAINALDKGIFTKDFLKSYESRLQKTVLDDFKTLRKGHGYMAGSNNLFTTYPKMAIDVMHSLYNVDGTPAEPVMTLIRRNLKGIKSLLTRKLVGLATTRLVPTVARRNVINGMRKMM